MTDFFVHDSSYVDSGAIVGEGTRVWHFSHISAGAQVGANCNIGQNVYIADGVEIGDNVKIQNNVSVYTGVTIEADAFLGPSMVFTNVINPRSHIPRKDEFKPTLVKRGVSIGANATILCGVTLGCYAFIGAGAVVTKDVPDYALVYGNPADIEGWMCQCGEKMHFDSEKETTSIVCLRCATEYSIQDGIVTMREESQ